MTRYPVEVALAIMRSHYCGVQIYAGNNECQKSGKSAISGFGDSDSYLSKPARILSGLALPVSSCFCEQPIDFGIFMVPEGYNILNHRGCDHHKPAIDETKFEHYPPIERVIEKKIEDLVRDESPTGSQDSLPAAFQPRCESHSALLWLAEAFATAAFYK